jgi:hypothetical protein
MSDYDNTNRGALFRNDEKSDDNDRDYAGTLDVDGTEYWLSGWVRTSKKSGRKYLSLSIKPKKAPKEKPRQTARSDDIDDEIPF